MKLGTLLLRNAAISLTQLEAALRAQVIYGGRLGTNLVELGFVDLDALATVLGELTQLPVATRSLLENAAPEAVSLIDGETAERLAAMPIALGRPPEATDIATSVRLSHDVGLTLAASNARIAGAFEQLAKGLEQRSLWMAHILMEPRFDPCRDDPRFAEFLRKVYGS